MNAVNIYQSIIYMHETSTSPMEGRTGIAKTSLSGTELAEVLGCLGSNVCAEFKCNTSDILAAYFHIEVHL
jgi:hypothetical protein